MPECWSEFYHFSVEAEQCVEEFVLTLLYRLGLVVSSVCGDTSTNARVRYRSTFAAKLSQSSAERAREFRRAERAQVDAWSEHVREQRLQEHARQQQEAVTAWANGEPTPPPTHWEPGMEDG